MLHLFLLNAVLRIGGFLFQLKMRCFFILLNDVEKHSHQNQDRQERLRDAACDDSS